MIIFYTGIASKGGSCRTGDSPGIFVNITFYREWVVHVMDSLGYPYQY